MVLRVVDVVVVVVILWLLLLLLLLLLSLLLVAENSRTLVGQETAPNLFFE